MADHVADPLHRLVIELDPSGMGNVYIDGQDVSSVFRGIELVSRAGDGATEVKLLVGRATSLDLRMSPDVKVKLED